MTTHTKNLGCTDPRRGFTLVELLVTVSIIAMLAGIVLGALNATRKTARIAKTKATIAKLNRIIMKQYNGYVSRRVPIDTAGMDPKDAAALRYKAVYDLMRLEMPDRSTDLKKRRNPVILSDRPATSKCYLTDWKNRRPSLNYLQAECLYKIVTTGSAAALENFSGDEIGDFDKDGWPEFQDAWGRPIMFLRWAPQFVWPNSDIQKGDPDPLDTYNQFAGSTHLTPLIYSGGPDKQYGISTGAFRFDGCPTVVLGGTRAGDLNDAGTIVGSGLHNDNIHNHRIEAR